MFYAILHMSNGDEMITVPYSNYEALKRDLWDATYIALTDLCGFAAVKHIVRFVIKERK